MSNDSHIETPPSILRFGVFELDLESQELRRLGKPCRLQPQPFKVMEMLARRAGRLVSREEIQKHVWKDDTFVDFDQGLNYCVRQIRGVLGDNASSPRFIETLPRRGYRFIAPVDAVYGSDSADAPAASNASSGGARSSKWLGFHRLALVVGIVLAVSGALAWLHVTNLDGSGSGRSDANSVDSGLDRKMVAVLPFRYRSLDGDLSRAYLSDILFEEIQFRLARLSPQRLGVIARTSSMFYKNSHKPLSQIADELGSDCLVTGDLEVSSHGASIQVELVKASTQESLWSQVFKSESVDALVLRGDVAKRIIARLSLKLAPKRVSPRVSVEPSPEAYGLYVEGRHLISKRSFPSGLDMLERALRLDPDFLDARAGLAYAYTQWAMFGDSAPEDALMRADREAQAVLTQDPENSQALQAAALFSLFRGWRWDQAGKTLLKAVEASPNDVAARLWHAFFLTRIGRHEESSAELAEARRLDPRSAAVLGEIAWSAYLAGRFQESVEAATTVLGMRYEFADEHVKARESLFQSLRMLGRPDLALQAGLRLPLVSPLEASQLEGLEARDAIRVLDEVRLSRLKDAAGRGLASGHYRVALLSILLELEPEALEALEWAMRAREFKLLEAGVEPSFAPLRESPQFNALKERLFEGCSNCELP